MLSNALPTLTVFGRVAQTQKSGRDRNSELAVLTSGKSGMSMAKCCSVDTTGQSNADRLAPSTVRLKWTLTKSWFLIEAPSKAKGPSAVVPVPSTWPTLEDDVKAMAFGNWAAIWSRSSNALL